MLSLANLPIEELRTQIGNGFVLMLLGMGIVFVFLTILVFTTKGVSKVVKKFEKEAPAKASVSASPSAAAAVSACTGTPLEGEVAAAILAAYSASRS